ncbi:NAD(P)H-dependent oxidoreductase subunit E [Actinoplanes sp. NBRC 103695]|uniref:NAD(P)H-dependent oxidoreductase subunit E n=1 Tax=Actinoplanes sp. NBRC 103695 TaxID=3032202 RepID=UPI0024A215A5|nr:NAD(P)H-dependent oxidoreductase subunit E [Actinoplanes sp. NBRC 103695]GLY96665.1 formate dehydrogenase subunit gamma [Actinoplanes sp. NBRC 103695]
MSEPPTSEPDRPRRKRREAAAPSPASLVDPAIAAPVRAAVAACREQRGNLIPILHEIQRTLGHVPEDAVPVLAEELNLSRAEVHGVITFYHDFKPSPVLGPKVQVCRAEACQAVGAEELFAAAPGLCGTVEQVFCLGNCALGPSVAIDGRVYGRMTASRLREVLA